MPRENIHLEHRETTESIKPQRMPKAPTASKSLKDSSSVLLALQHTPQHAQHLVLSWNAGSIRLTLCIMHTLCEHVIILRSFGIGKLICCSHGSHTPSTSLNRHVQKGVPEAQSQAQAILLQVHFCSKLWGAEFAYCPLLGSSKMWCICSANVF